MRPSRSVLAVSALLAGLALMSVPAAVGAPGAGSLSFGGDVSFDGTLSGHGRGELQMHALDGAFSGTADAVHVLRVWYETEVIRNPVGGPVRTETGPVHRSWTNLTDASFVLQDTQDGFASLVYPAAKTAQIALADTSAADLRLAAYDRPALVVDPDGQLRDDARVFTYGADGARFPVPATVWSATGSLVVFVDHASFEVDPAEGDAVTFRSGDATQETSPTSHKEVHGYHLLHLTGAALSFGASDAVGWFADPVWSLEGTFTAERASGTLEVNEEAYALDADPLTVGGVIELRPKVIGEPEFVAGAAPGTHIGTSAHGAAMYPTMGSDLSGDVTVLAIGTELPFVDEGGLAVAAAAGVFTLAAVVFLMTPKGKWLALGLFAPLYAKTEKDKLLENESRERLFQAIRNNPGINLSQVHRLADLGWGVTVYHLKMMEKRGLVFSEAGARERCFFENDPKFLALRGAIAALANKEPAQRIGTLIAAEPGITQRELVARTGLTQRVVSYHVSRLAKEGLVERERDGNFVVYRPAEGLAEALRYVQPAGEVPVGSGGSAEPVGAHA